MKSYAFVFVFFLSWMQFTTAFSQKDSLQSACDSTRYPEFCVSTLKAASSIWNISNSVDFGKVSLSIGIKEAKKVFKMISKLARWALKQQQRYALDDCMELFEITLEELSTSFSNVDFSNASSAMEWEKSMDVQTWLSAAITNQATCLESLQESKSAYSAVLSSPLAKVTKSLSNSLALVKKIKIQNKSKSKKKSHHRSSASPQHGRRLLSENEEDGPFWKTSRRLTRLLQSHNDDINVLASGVVTVSQDGTGNFSTITDAINYVPVKNSDVHVIYVRQGVYHEYVTVPKHKINIMLVGDGVNSTVITGDHNVVDGWTTFRSATLAVMGKGFLARDLTFENTAGPSKHQAVAVRVSSDFSAFYRCAFKGYQDTLYAHSLRQFYRDCNIYGTVDFIFGNAAAVFQNCNLYVRKPMNKQTNVCTAQGRDDPNMNTGFSIQKCAVSLSPEIENERGNFSVPTFMGRPWRIYSRTVIMQSYIDTVVNKEGWQKWSGEIGLSTLYYGEFMNVGPGAPTSQRVLWPGFHVMNNTDALNFTLSNFIRGDAWIRSVPFDLGL